MKLLFAGVRGSTPVSGPDFRRVGGHTSCVAVLRDGEDTPALILDAGTGIMNLTARFGDAPFVGTILLTHLHWDHVQGLPFFRSADREDACVTLGVPAQGDVTEVLRRSFSPPHFPIGPDGLLGSWRFVGLEPGTAMLEGFEVTSLAIPHKGGRAYGYRVSDGTRSFAYLPDHGPRGPDATPADTGARTLAVGVDLLVHGAPFVAAERAFADRYGHSTVDDAIALADDSAGVSRLALTHHGPTRADTAVDEIAHAAALAFSGELLVAREGCSIAV